MIFAVIDTNVIVAAMMSKHSDSATVKVINAVREGRLKPALGLAWVRTSAARLPVPTAKVTSPP